MHPAAAEDVAQVAALIAEAMCADAASDISASEEIERLLRVHDALVNDRYADLSDDQRSWFEARLLDELWGRGPIVRPELSRFIRREAFRTHIVRAFESLGCARPDITCDKHRYETLAAYARQTQAGHRVARHDWEHKLEEARTWRRLPTTWRRFRAIHLGEF